MDVRKPAAWLPVAALVGVAVLFGATYTVMQSSMTATDPMSFLALRFAFGAAALWPFACRRRGNAGELAAGLAGGGALLVGYVCLALGMERSTSAGSALALNLMVIVVPLAHSTLARQLPHRSTMFAALLAVGGVRLMADGGLGDGSGLLLSAAAALAFGVHVLIGEATARRYDAIRLTAIQLTVVAVGCVTLGLADGDAGSAVAAWPSALFMGVVVSAAALSVQLWAQRDVCPGTVAVVFCIEPVVAVLVGYHHGEPVAGTAVWGVLAVLAAIGLTATARPPGSRSGRLPERAKKIAPANGPIVGAVSA